MGIKCQNCNGLNDNNSLVIKCIFCSSIIEYNRYVKLEEIISWCKTTMNCDKKTMKTSSNDKIMPYCKHYGNYCFKAIYICMKESIINAEAKKQKSLNDFTTGLV